MYGGSEHVETITGNRHDVPIAGRQLCPKSCARCPAAAARGIVEIGARAVAAQILVGLVEHDSIIKHDCRIAKYIPNSKRQVFWIYGRLTGCLLRRVIQAVSAAT